MAVLQNNTEQQQRPHPRHAAVAGPDTVEQPRVPTHLQHYHEQETGQLVRIPNLNSSSLNDMFKVATVVQRIMTK
jgi:hypothetical protein